MFGFLKKIILHFLKVPAEPLDPMGDVNSLMVFRASPNYFKYRLYVWILRNIFSACLVALGAGITFAALFRKGDGLEILFAILGLMFVLASGLCHLVISFIVLRLDYEMRWYKISDRSLRIREGVVFVREMTMTFANIQNIAISQGPIQRFFGIADLRVETAGGGGVIQPDHNNQHPAFSMHIGVFKGIDNYENARDIMLSRLKKLRDSGLGDIDEKREEVIDVTPVVDTQSNLLHALLALRDEARRLRTSASRL